MYIRQRSKNIFVEIWAKGHDLDFEPHSTPIATAAPPGSLEKIRVMCERLAAGEELHHPNDMQTTASMELQHEMSTIVMAEAKALRASLKVTREEQQPKRVMALHAARATRERILEVKRVKQIIKRRSAT